VGFDSQRRGGGLVIRNIRGQVTVADGTKEMAKRIERVLTMILGWEWYGMWMPGYHGSDCIREENGVKVPMQ